MRKTVFLSISLLFLTIIVFVPGVIAESNDNNSVTIIKYKLTEEILKETNLPVDGTQATKLIDPDGRSLVPMKGISYLVERVTLSDSDKSVNPVKGINAFKVQIVTNDSGIAYIHQLEQGTYRITEEENKGIKHPMDPVVLNLPLPRPNGELLNDVFLYPKSSVADEEAQVVVPEKETGKLPQTSGNLGSYESIIWSIGLVFAMGVIGIYLIYQKSKLFKWQLIRNGEVSFFPFLILIITSKRVRDFNA